MLWVCSPWSHWNYCFYRHLLSFWCYWFLLISDTCISDWFSVHVFFSLFLLPCVNHFVTCVYKSAPWINVIIPIIIIVCVLWCDTSVYYCNEVTVYIKDKNTSQCLTEQRPTLTHLFRWVINCWAGWSPGALLTAVNVTGEMSCSRETDWSTNCLVSNWSNFFKNWKKYLQKIECKSKIEIHCIAMSKWKIYCLY